MTSFGFLPKCRHGDAHDRSQVLLIQSGARPAAGVDNLKLIDDPRNSGASRDSGSDQPVCFSSGSVSGRSKVRKISVRATIEILRKRLKAVRQRADRFLSTFNGQFVRSGESRHDANAVCSSLHAGAGSFEIRCDEIANDWLNRQLGTLQGAESAPPTRPVEGLPLRETKIIGRALRSRIKLSTSTRTKQDATSMKGKIIPQNLAHIKRTDPGSLAEALSSDPIRSRPATQYAELAKKRRRYRTVRRAAPARQFRLRRRSRNTRRLINEEMQRPARPAPSLRGFFRARARAAGEPWEGSQGTDGIRAGADPAARASTRGPSDRTLYESFPCRFKETSAQESLRMPELAGVGDESDIPIPPSFPKNMLIVGLGSAARLVLRRARAAVDFLDQRIEDAGFRPRPVSGLRAKSQRCPRIGLRELAGDQARPGELKKLTRPNQPPAAARLQAGAHGYRLRNRHRCSREGDPGGPSCGPAGSEAQCREGFVVTSAHRK